MFTSTLLVLSCMVVFVGMALGPLDTSPLLVRAQNWRLEWDQEEQLWQVYSPLRVIAASFPRKSEAEAWLNRVTRDEL